MNDDKTSSIFGSGGFGSGGGNPPDLQSWNLEDLEDYITALSREITRAQAKIDEKKAVGSAAASLFKSQKI